MITLDRHGGEDKTWKLETGGQVFFDYPHRYDSTGLHVSHT